MTAPRVRLCAESTNVNAPRAGPPAFHLGLGQVAGVICKLPATAAKVPCLVHSTAVGRRLAAESGFALRVGGDYGHANRA